jgi:hypothetical protein
LKKKFKNFELKNIVKALTGILEVFKNSSRASSDPSVDACTKTPCSLSLILRKIDFKSLATMSLGRKYELLDCFEMFVVLSEIGTKHFQFRQKKSFKLSAKKLTDKFQLHPAFEQFAS